MKCDICGRDLYNRQICRASGKTLCAKHYQQIIKFGHPLDTNQRTVKDLNEFEINGDGTASIFLYNSKSEVIGSFLIDEEDLNRVITHKWRLWNDRVFTGVKKPVSIHHFILGVKSNIVIDHINSNPLDNRKCNLRECTHQLNRLNNIIPSNNTSGFAGVRWSDNRKKWEVEIRANNKRSHLGRYSLQEDAVYARYIAEVLLYKEFRSTQNDSEILPLISKCTCKDKIKKYVTDKLLNKGIL